MLNFGKQFYKRIIMKQLEVFNKIGIIIKELNDQYNYIEANPANLNELELELFVANAKFLADHAEILIKLNQKNKTEKLIERETGSNEKYFEPVVQPKPELKGRRTLSEPANEPASPVDISSGTPEDSYSFIREEPDVIRHELVVDETESFSDDEGELPVAEEKTEQPVAIEEPAIPNEEEDKSLAKNEATIKDEVVTINQKISSQLSSKTNITEQAGTQPVTDLKQAITLNDKLLYVKDLFNGYSLAYSEAIEILNRFNTFEEADRFLNKNYVVKHNWEDKPETTGKFYALLKRRYS
ncbi:MAG: hypothetical protein JWR23_1049 [Mucilaginibacter sp.]|nr:hypothetical protein [Mucilaginibacter sp.]